MTRAILAGLGLAALAASPAMALDCQRASTASEKAICADPTALAADADLGKAFAALHASLDPKAKTQLGAAEVAWLALRDSNCADEKGPALGACLARETRARIAFLAGAPEAGPGAPGRLAPVLRMQKGGEGRTDVDVQLLKFVDAVTPAERAFNAAVDRLTNDLENPGKDDPLADQWSYTWSMRIAYASPRLISAHADGDSFMGGAHPNSYSVNINVEGARGREATFADMLDKPAADKIFASVPETGARREVGARGVGRRRFRRAEDARRERRRGDRRPQGVELRRRRGDGLLRSLRGRRLCRRRILLQRALRDAAAAGASRFPAAVSGEGQALRSVVTREAGSKRGENRLTSGSSDGGKRNWLRPAALAS